MSFCDVLPPSLLSSVVFPVLVSRKLSRSRRCAVATSAIRGVSWVAVSHLLVAVRFFPTREGSGTKSSGRRPKNRATFQVSPLSMWYAAGYFRFFFYWWDDLGLRFFAQPAVTSASEVLTETYVARLQCCAIPFSVFRSVLLFCLVGMFKNVAVSKNKRT